MQVRHRPQAKKWPLPILNGRVGRPWRHLASPRKCPIQKFPTVWLTDPGSGIPDAVPPVTLGEDDTLWMSPCTFCVPLFVL